MNRTSLLSVLLALSLLTGCAAHPDGSAEHAVTIFAMDTVMTITAYGSGSEAAVQEAASQVRALEGLLSVTSETSEIYAANHSGGAPVTVSDETALALASALSLCESTGGALDVTIYPVVRAWGFTTGNYRVPEADELSALLARVDHRAISLDGNTLTVPAGMQLDLGAAAKGWTGDQLIALLREAGIASAKLELGGNVQLLGSKPDGSPWRIAVRDPFGEGYVGVLEAADEAVVTSGGYERYFEADGETYWHILDPSTGRPARSGLASVTIVAESGALADGLSTALFVMGGAQAAEYWRSNGGFDFILVSEDGSVSITEGLEERFTLSGDWAEAELNIVRT